MCVVWGGGEGRVGAAVDGESTGSEADEPCEEVPLKALRVALATLPATTVQRHTSSPESSSLPQVP